MSCPAAGSLAIRREALLIKAHVFRPFLMRSIKGCLDLELGGTILKARPVALIDDASHRHRAKQG